MWRLCATLRDFVRWAGGSSYAPASGAQGVSEISVTDRGLFSFILSCAGVNSGGTKAHLESDHSTFVLHCI